MTPRSREPDVPERGDASARGLIRETYGFLIEDPLRAARKILPSYVGADLGRPGIASCLEAFTSRAILFARLERLFQGDVVFELPAHLSVLRGDLGADPVLEGWSLAEEERRLLETGISPLDDFADILDRKGIKVLPARCPVACAGVLFEEITGPAVLVDRPPDSPEGRAAMAHAFGHFVADVNPYRIRFCLLGSGLRDTPEEARAEAFARALLLPADAFPSGTDLEDDEVRDIAGIYEAPEGLVRQRSADILDPDRRWEGIVLREITGPEEDWDPPPPPRFLDLVLMAFSKGMVDGAGLQVLLGADENRVWALLQWAEERPGSDAPA